MYFIIICRKSLDKKVYNIINVLQFWKGQIHLFIQQLVFI